jgi:hypothetical protein
MSYLEDIIGHLTEAELRALLDYFAISEMRVTRASVKEWCRIQRQYARHELAAWMLADETQGAMHA